MKVIVIANPVPKKILEVVSITSDDYVIAVDGAFDDVFRQKIKVDLIVGDLDSLKLIKKTKGIEIVKLPKEKNETDTLVAIKKAYTLSQSVFLIGGIKGKRIEHFLANLTILNQFPNLLWLDQDSKVYLHGPGKHTIMKNGYVNFFGYPDVIVTLEGFKYPLKKYHLKSFDPLCISNEIIGTYAELTVEEGKVLVIETKKKD